MPNNPKICHSDMSHIEISYQGIAPAGSLDEDNVWTIQQWRFDGVINPDPTYLEFKEVPWANRYVLFSDPRSIPSGTEIYGTGSAYGIGVYS